MSNDSNYFDKLIQSGVADVKRVAEKINLAAGAGKTPVGKVKLTSGEKLKYFKSLPEDQKYQIWGEMEPDEQDEIRQGMTQGG